MLRAVDPLTHTLFGAVLADTGLRRQSALATATLVIGANLPDIDVVAHFVDMDASLAWRRGWSHGVLALVVLPLALTAVMVGFDRWRRRRGHRGPPVDAARLLPLAALGVVSHPLLDWLNTYGVRLLMPFDGRWFYGDALFIVDPWLWLLLGGALFLGRSSGRRALAAWSALGLLMTAAVLVGAEGHPWAPWVWFAGVATLVVVRFGRATSPMRRDPIARGALAVALVYMGLMVLGSEWAETAAADDLAAAGVATTAPPRVGPERLDPSLRLVVAPVDGGYRVGTIRPLRTPRLQLEPYLVPAVATSWTTNPSGSPDASSPDASSPDPLAIVDAAQAGRCVAGFVGWMRLPFAVVDEAPDGYRVHLLDARYRRAPGDGFGGATVWVGEDLAAVCADE